MEDPRIISALFIFLKMAYYNVLINKITLVRSSIHPDNIPLVISFAHVHLKSVSLFAHHVGTGDNPKILRNWHFYLRYVSTLP